MAEADKSDRLVSATKHNQRGGRTELKETGVVDVEIVAERDVQDVKGGTHRKRRQGN